ncbi:hypothetical protein [Persicobacter sp. CCB-QB2]|uniref:hypothetical protein n=1 Tax=Persicobacter sp. CCB-QB2 TaxID=1561025 RepID=UPI0006A9AB73|nr:hypothetical protein [Persicobacter sp. CCB-QB2]
MNKATKIKGYLKLITPFTILGTISILHLIHRYVVGSTMGEWYRHFTHFLTAFTILLLVAEFILQAATRGNQKIIWLLELAGILGFLVLVIKVFNITSI